MSAYYNEINPYCAQWLRNLMQAGLIANGWVDERSIKDVRARDLWEFDQHHFFAGIGIWSAALRAAGIDDEYPVWTGSCPCQPFSRAGKQDGFNDARHLWPYWKNLIEQLRPTIILGEQIGELGGLAWFDLVSTDLEGMDYACGAILAAAAGFGAPHSRQRLWFVARDLGITAREFERWAQETQPPYNLGGSGNFDEVADAVNSGYSTRGISSGALDARNRGDLDELGYDSRARIYGFGNTITSKRHQDIAGNGARILDESQIARLARERRATGGFWANAEWVPCRDGKWRPIEPGTFPLVDGATCRVERLRAYGNALVLPAATEFVRAALDAIEEM